MGDHSSMPGLVSPSDSDDGQVPVGGGHLSDNDELSDSDELCANEVHQWVLFGGGHQLQGILMQHEIGITNPWVRFAYLLWRRCENSRWRHIDQYNASCDCLRAVHVSSSGMALQLHHLL